MAFIGDVLVFGHIVAFVDVVAFTGDKVAFL